MSLDVYLVLEDSRRSDNGSGIFVREDGQIKEISYDEWNEKFPGRAPVVTDSDDDGEVYHANITHNLNTMAEAAGIYKHLWRPDEIGITTADQLIEPLRNGLKRLVENRAYYEQFNPSNGWGDYKGFVLFVRYYLQACEEYPLATVRASR